VGVHRRRNSAEEEYSRKEREQREGYLIERLLEHLEHREA